MQSQEQQLLQKNTLFLFTGFCSVAGTLWGCLLFYFLENLSLPVFLPWFFALVISICMLIAKLTKWLRLLLIVQLTLIFLLPGLLQMSLGGFVNSGGVIMWSMLAPICSLFFQSVRSAINWFYAFVLGFFTVASIESSLTTHSFINESTQRFFLIINIVGLSITVFASVLYFVKRLEATFERNQRLLHIVLPESIAKRMGKSDKPFVQHVNSATILFADIVGFTKLSERLSPDSIVKLLNQIFSAFDQLADINKVEKIKTIGDAYMVAGNIPLPLKDHPEHIADMAIEMHRIIYAIAKEKNLPLELRIGIHTGPVAAGVIGHRRMAYDLWGDSVNIASRMESHGIAGYTQISQESAKHLKDDFVIEARGTLEIKGKGTMKTYFLHNRKSESTLRVQTI